MGNNIIYSDKLVDVIDNGIRIKEYYFPSARAKFIKFSEIKKISKQQPTLKNGKWRYWGTGDFVTWFPSDWNRSKREYIFLMRLTSQRIRIGFTVENSKAFIEAIESKGIEIET